MNSLQKLEFPLFVIIEEFELFTQCHKQSLLYCLFNMCFSNEYSLVVVGETSRYNCIELLEKRVKSRFSQRIITMDIPNGFGSMDVFKRIVLEWPFKGTELFSIVNDCNSVNQAIQLEWQTTRNPRNIFNYFIKALLLSQNLQEFQNNLQDFNRDYWKIISTELSPLCAALLICIKKLSSCSSTRDKITFESVYNSHRSYSMGNEGISPNPSIYGRAFEKLIDFGFISYSDKRRGRSSIPKEFRTVCLNISSTLIDEQLLSTGQFDISASLRKWAISD